MQVLLQKLGNPTAECEQNRGMSSTVIAVSLGGVAEFSRGMSIVSSLCV